MLKLATKFAPNRAALETAYCAGFRYAELWLDAGILADWQTILRHTGHYPNGYALHFPNQLDLGRQSLEAVCALYLSLGARCLVIHQPMLARHQGALLSLAPTIQLAVENHKLSPQEFTEWAEKNPGLALDVEHLWKFTLRDCPLAQLIAHLHAFLSRFADKLLHVHLPGYWPGFDEHRPMYCAREMIFGVLTLLSETGFQGLVVSEVATEHQNSAELRMDVLLFEAWRARHDPLLAALPGTGSD